MKKIFAILFLVVTLFCVMMPITVAAEEAPNTVIIDCNAIGSDAYKKTLRVYFENIETGEIIDRKITTIGNNKFTDIPAGEYRYVKCTLYRKDSVVYELARDVENLVVYEDQPSVFTFKLAKTATETYEGAMDDYKKELKGEIIYALLSVAIITLLICWIVFAIIGRKINRMKWVARFVSHMFISTVCLLIAMAATNLNPDLAFVWFVGAGIPYGTAAASMLFVSSHRNAGAETAAQARSRGTAEVSLVFCVGAIIGAVALPIIFVVDIVRIFRNPECY